MKRRVLLVSALVALVGAGAGGCLRTSGPTQPAGAPAPAFSATSHRGERISSAELLARGPLVIVFYRGFWWTFCQSQLGELAQHEARFEERGIALVAISADEPLESRDFARREGIGFPLLSDEDLAIAKAFGVANEDEEIAVPAAFVLDRGGVIRWREVGAHIADRVSPDALLEQARATL